MVSLVPAEESVLLPWNVGCIGTCAMVAVESPFDHLCCAVGLREARFC